MLIMTSDMIEWSLLYRDPIAIMAAEERDKVKPKGAIG